MRRFLSALLLCLALLGGIALALWRVPATSARVSADSCEIRARRGGVAGEWRAVDPARYPEFCAAPTPTPTRTPRPRPPFPTNPAPPPPPIVPTFTPTPMPTATRSHYPQPSYPPNIGPPPPPVVPTFTPTSR